MVELKKMKIEEFVKKTASKEATPGGGAVGALTGAIGAGLTSMVCELTMGKEKYKANEEIIKEIDIEIKEIIKKLVESIQKDKEAFSIVCETLRMPKETEAQREDRKTEIQKALKEATLAPIEVMETAYIGLKLTEKAVGKSNKNVASDLGIASINLEASIKSSWLNVLINLKEIEDKEFTEKYRNKGENLLKKGIELAEQIYNAIRIDLT